MGQRRHAGDAEVPLDLAFDPITVDAAQMGGVPCVGGLRFPVATAVAMVADGMTTAEILAEHPRPGGRGRGAMPSLCGTRRAGA